MSETILEQLQSIIKEKLPEAMGQSFTEFFKKFKELEDRVNVLEPENKKQREQIEDLQTKLSKFIDIELREKTLKQAEENKVIKELTEKHEKDILLQQVKCSEEKNANTLNLVDKLFRNHEFVKRVATYNTIGSNYNNWQTTYYPTWSQSEEKIEDNLSI